MTIDLSVVVVNYRSAALCEGLVASVREDRFLVGGRHAETEIVIVDNASPGDDVRVLERLVDSRTTLLRNTENVGYALANNQGFRVARGRFHLVVNPDCRVLSGALGTMVDVLLSAPDAGCVGPLASMDVAGEVLLPPNESPDPYREHLAQSARRSSKAAAYHARRRATFAHGYWTATAPVALDMLSGGCFLGRRETFQEHGLFDGAYPLYYEDTDLFRRLTTRGLKLWHAPAARIVHYFSRSAITRMKAAMARADVGARRYFETWFGGAGLRAFETQRARAARDARDHVSPWPTKPIVGGAAPPVVDVPNKNGVFLEIAGNPQFTLAAGMFPKGPGPYALPSEFYGQLGPGSYWIRAVDPKDGATLDAWALTKAV